MELTKIDYEELTRLISNEMEYLAKCNKYRTDRYYKLQDLYERILKDMYEKYNKG